MFSSVRAIRSTTAIAAISLVMVSCASGGGTSQSKGPFTDEDFYHHFQTVVASADGYQPYWLGRNFEVQGITFAGPSLGIDSNDSGSVAPEYMVQQGPAFGAILTIGEFSPAAWAAVKDRVALVNPRSVTINGNPAQIAVVSGGVTRPVGNVVVHMTLGGTELLFTTNATVEQKRGVPDPNPLLDEATFLDVLATLRPYPD